MNLAETLSPLDPQVLLLLVFEVGGGAVGLLLLLSRITADFDVLE